MMSSARLMALNSICARACSRQALPSCVAMERLGTCAGETSSGRAGRPGKCAGTGRTAVTSSVSMPCNWATASHLRAGWSINKACSAALRKSFLQFSAPPAFGNPHNHVGNEGEQEDHKVHPGHALQAFNDCPINFEGPPFGRECEHLPLTVRQALWFHVALQGIYAHTPRNPDHQGRKGNVAVPGFADAIVDDAVEDTAYWPAERFHDRDGHEQRNEKGGDEQRKEHRKLRKGARLIRTSC